MSDYKFIPAPPLPPGATELKSVGPLLEYADLRQRFFGEDRNTALIHAAGVMPGPFQTAEEAFVIASRSLLAVDASNAKWIAL